LQILIIYFGDILGALVLFNPNIPGSADILDKVVRDAVTKMVVIGALTFAAATIHTYCWAISGENQAKRIRESFFKSLCSQDVAWFDRNSTGELTTRLTSDLNLIQDGISSKPGMAIKSVCAFVTGNLLLNHRIFYCAY
jgi:ABC-type multidrug transport system fused ATPase/permease subunit